MFSSNNSQVANDVKYIEEYFSTFLYSGTGSSQTINNGIDLATKGGLVWIKTRNQTYNHYLTDSSSGIGNYLSSNATNAQNIYGAQTDDLTSFNTNGFSLGADGNLGWVNASGSNMVSWSFAKTPKFFDVVTYTGNGVAGRTIAHNLGSVPGCIIVKATSNAAEGLVYHKDLGNTKYLTLFSAANGANAADIWSGAWNDTSPTSTNFTVGSGSNVNADGWTFVAYLFAHNAGGFGATETENVISCGSFSGNTTVNLGFEPQWILLKRSSGAERWYIIDNMRGWPVSGDANYLAPNTSDAENQTNQIYPNATGFSTLPGGGDFIYIAIRRGPMKVPTDATKVFAPQTRTGTGSADTITGVGFPVDLVIDKPRNADTGSFEDRLRGSTQNLVPSSTGAETTSNSTWDVTSFASMDGISVGISGNVNINTSGTATVNWFFRRAPSFFDVVCYTGNGSGSGQVINHNLGVTPELIIIKSRSGAYQWHVYAAPLGQSKALFLENTSGEQANTAFTGGTINSTQFQLKVDFANVNGSGVTYVAYLFATCAGVSKCTAFTGTGTLQTINCGFTSGARFVLIKRTDSTGDWYVWDSSRGLSSSTDPYLLLNSTAAEVTSTNWVDTTSTGFQVTAASGNNVNINGASYIALAIA